MIKSIFYTICVCFQAVGREGQGGEPPRVSQRRKLQQRGQRGILWPSRRQSPQARREYVRGRSALPAEQPVRQHWRLCVGVSNRYTMNYPEETHTSRNTCAQVTHLWESQDEDREVMSGSQKHKLAKNHRKWSQQTCKIVLFFAATLQPDEVPNLLAKEELNLLARIMGSMKTEHVHSAEGSFRLNLFASDQEEEEAWVFFYSHPAERSGSAQRSLHCWTGDLQEELGTSKSSTFKPCRWEGLYMKTDSLSKSFCVKES